MKKASKVVLYFMLLLGIGLTAYALYRNEQLKAKNMRDQELGRQEWFLLQCRALRGELPSNLHFWDSERQSLQMADVAYAPRLCLYIDNGQCTTCWRSELDYLRYLVKDRKGLIQPFVLAGNFRPRDLKLLQWQDSIPLPLYGVALDSSETLFHLSLATTPFLFVLYPNGSISDVVFLTDAVRPYMKAYLDRLENEFFSETAAKSDGLLSFLNSSVNLGKIRLRKKQEVIFFVRNVSDKRLKVHNVRLSCDCLTSKSFPKEIAPGEIAEFVVSFLAISPGDFVREISFQIGGSEALYRLELLGTVF